MLLINMSTKESDQELHQSIRPSTTSLIMQMK